jgi:hypothetical protein
MALLRHSGIYFAARIFAGGASFALIAAYTRLLDPHAFGELALSIAGVTFFDALILDGPMLAMQRYLPGQSEAARAPALWGLILPAVAAAAIAVVVFLLAAPERWRVQLALCAGLLFATLLHQFQLTAAQGALRPGKYALLGSLESILDMLVGITLVWLGYGGSRRVTRHDLCGADCGRHQLARLVDRLVVFRRGLGPQDAALRPAADRGHVVRLAGDLRRPLAAGGVFQRGKGRALQVMAMSAVHAAWAAS